MISANPSLIHKLSKTFPTFSNADIWLQTGQFQGETADPAVLGIGMLQADPRFNSKIKSRYCTPWHSLT